MLMCKFITWQYQVAIAQKELILSSGTVRLVKFNIEEGRVCEIESGLACDESLESQQRWHVCPDSFQNLCSPHCVPISMIKTSADG